MRLVRESRDIGGDRLREQMQIMRWISIIETCGGGTGRARIVRVQVVLQNDEKHKHLDCAYCSRPRINSTISGACHDHCGGGVDRCSTMGRRIIHAVAKHVG